MKYNKFEIYIADKLDKYPHISQISKSLYKRLSYMFYHKKGFISELHPKISIKGILGENKNNLEAFFGYYDKSPWSYNSKYYLVHIFDKKYKDKVKIAVYDCESNNLKSIDETSAFNFQQGAMLRWLNKKGYLVIYNTIENGNLVAKVRDAISGEEIKVVPMPIQTVNYEGTEALTLNYKRLDKIRPEYGYKVDVKNFSADMPGKEDGIWRVNLVNGKSGLIVNLADLMTLNHNKTMDKSQHKINHIMYSPSGKRFVFMHRWIGSRGKFSRLYTANTDGSDIYCLADDKIVSHYCWLDDEHLIAWMRKKAEGDKYFLLKDKSDVFKTIGDGVLEVFGDGHPSVHPNREWIVTDTYPDKAGVQKLILFNLKTGEEIIIGSLFTPWMYNGAYRCDFHPRWSPDGSKISIDSTHEGFRNSYIIDIPEI